MEWFSLITSAAGGGILGLIGTGAKMYMAHKEQEQKDAHEIAMAVESRQNMQMELNLLKQKGEMQLSIDENNNDAKNLTAAISAERDITGTSQWVADLRGATRPFLTFGLVILSAFKPTDDYIFMATTAVTFWFGDRPRKK